MANSEQIFWTCSGVSSKVCHLGAEQSAPRWHFPRTLCQHLNLFWPLTAPKWQVARTHHSCRKAPKWQSSEHVWVWVQNKLAFIGKCVLPMYLCSAAIDGSFLIGAHFCARAGCIGVYKSAPQSKKTGRYLMNSIVELNSANLTTLAQIGKGSDLLNSSE